MPIKFSAALCFLLCRALAAEVELAGPILGFLYDPANGLQPILGVAGASTVGQPLDFTSGFSKVVISPRQDYALAVSASNPNFLRVMMGDPVSVEQFGIPISTTGLAALSPTGSSAAFLDRDRNRIQVIAGLPSAPTLAWEFELSTFSGALASLAVSDDASVVIAGFSEVEENPVAALGVGGPVRFLTGPRRATAAAFLPGARDVVIADGPASEIYLVRDAVVSGESTLLASAGQGISEPIAVAVSRDGKRAFVSSASARRVALIDLAAGTTSSIPCPCSPSELVALNGNVFQLTASTAGPIWLLDADAVEPENCLRSTVPSRH